MSNTNQSTMIPEQYSGYIAAIQPKPKSKKMLIVGIVVGITLCLVVLLVLLLSNGWQTPHLAKDNTSTLQLYAVLENGTLIDDLEKVAGKIDERFEVVVDHQEDSGVIRLPDAKDYIIFTFYREIIDDNFEEEESRGGEEEGQWREKEEEIIDENFEYVPYAAYDVTYVLKGETEETLSYNVFEQLYEYYDGIDVFQFETKKEAIEGYLAS